MPFRVLVTGDIHIGRTSTRLPESISGEAARAVNGWHAVVEHAVSGAFDLLVLTGDVTDQDNRFWEAIGPLEQGIHRLGRHGIHTVAVSGNHDYDALPRLADHLETSHAFTLLGRGGRWERYTAEVDGRPVLHIDGWSFPGEVVETDPVASYRPQAADGVPVLGVVHGDLDVPASRYAPLSRALLLQQEVDGWLLGHIHKPEVVIEGPPFILYPGSPQALDFGEPGVHGAWGLEVDARHVTLPVRHPLSAVRYEEIEVELTEDVEDEDGLDRIVYAALGEAEKRCREESGEILQSLSVRLRLTGRSPLFDRLSGERKRLGDRWRQLSDYTGSLAGLAVRVDDVRSELLPAVELKALARGASPLAVAARFLVELESNPEAPETQELLDAAARQLDGVAGKRTYTTVREDPFEESVPVRALVRDQLTFIIGELLSQRDGRP